MTELRSTSIAIACLAGAVMAFELALIRIFSFVTWYHFASMVISVALLGFGLSGVVLQLQPGLGRPPRRRAALYCGAFALTSVAAVAALSRLPFDLLSVTRDPGELLRLLVNYLVLVVPFTFAGLAIATLLQGYASRSGLLYGCDLVGAALGCLAVVAVTARVGVEGVVLGAGSLAALGASLLARSGGGGGSSGPARAWATVAAALLLLVPWASDGLVIRAGPGKAFYRYLAGSPDVEVTFSHWNALFRTDVMENGPPVPWIANAARGVRPPEHHQILIDGDSLTPVVRQAGMAPESLAFLDYMLPSLGLQALGPERVLVIGAGGGVDVLAALHHGARRVDAVEVNSDIVHLVTETFADWNDGLFLRDEVKLHLDEGRSFVRRSTERYDHIQLSLVDTWASSAAGAYSLAEGYLYTVEAFEDYLSHLSDRGVVSLGRWLHSPPRETLRVVSVAIAALERLGVEDPRRHVVIAAGGRVSNTLVKRTPFSAGEVRAIVDAARQRGFQLIYVPGLAWTDSTNAFTELLLSEDRQGFYDRYPYDVTPTTDERPFFFQFLRWSQAGSLSFSGKGLLLVVFVQALVLSLALLVLPLAWGRVRGRRLGAEAGTIGYFLFLGIAFMLIEIGLMQRFTLYLGHPVYGIALVLAVLLLGAGAGSLAVSRLVPAGRSPEGVFGALIGLIAIYALALPSLFRATLGWELSLRLVFAALLILPIAFLLGIPFPAALARLQGPGGSQLGWAWAANGCGSVLGPLLAVILALDLGYGRVMLIAALLYGAAYLLFRRRWNVNPA